MHFFPRSLLFSNINCIIINLFIFFYFSLDTNAVPVSPDSAIGSPELGSPDDRKTTPFPVQPNSDQQQTAINVPLLIEGSGSEDKSIVEEDSDENEDSMSESEMVVTGSMQFALTPAAVAKMHSSNSSDVETGSNSPNIINEESEHSPLLESATEEKIVNEPSVASATNADDTLPPASKAHEEDASQSNDDGKIYFHSLYNYYIFINACPFDDLSLS